MIIKYDKAPFKGSLCIGVTDNHFLYKMVKNIVGLLIDTRLNKRSLSEIKELLNKKNRTYSGGNSSRTWVIFTQHFIYIDSKQKICKY